MKTKMNPGMKSMMNPGMKSMMNPGMKTKMNPGMKTMMNLGMKMKINLGMKTKMNPEKIGLDPKLLSSIVKGERDLLNHIHEIKEGLLDQQYGITLILRRPNILVSRFVENVMLYFQLDQELLL
jgi:hypothetical protein